MWIVSSNACRKFSTRFSRRSAGGSLHPSAGPGARRAGIGVRFGRGGAYADIGYGMRGRAAGAGAPGLGYAAFAIRYATMGIWMGPGCPVLARGVGTGGGVGAPVRPRVSRYKI